MIILKQKNQRFPRIFLYLLYSYFFNIRIYYLIRRKDSDPPTPVLLLSCYCRDETRIERKCSCRRDTSVSPSPRIHCRETIHFTSKRRDITPQLEGKAIDGLYPSFSQPHRQPFVTLSNRTLVNGQNRFRCRSTRRNVVVETFRKKKNCF